jgi:hypothetical protein
LQADWRDGIDRENEHPMNSEVFAFLIDPIAQRRFARPVEPQPTPGSSWPPELP